MKYILVIVCFFFFNTLIIGQIDTIESSLLNQPEDIVNASVNAKEILIDMNNPEDVELALKRIHTYKYIETIIIEGESDENDLKKLLYRLSVLKNLTSITLKNNELTKIPDNITNIKTLKSVTIEENNDLDYPDLFLKLSRLQINELNLTDNDLKKNVLNLSEITSLKKIVITGNNQLDYENLVEQLAQIPGLINLSIPVNYITELPTNIIKLKSLQVLDVSNNILSDFPPEVSSLKAINNLSIQGNLFLNPVKDLEKFKENEILYLSLDKEVTGEEIEQIKKMFPKAEISFPLEEEESKEEIQKPIKHNTEPKKEEHSGELKAKRVFSILSDAYLSYPALYQGIVYNFDTLNFEERYVDMRYTNVYQKIQNRTWSAGAFNFRTWCRDYEKPGKKNETWFRLPLMNQSISLNYSEFRAFSGMYWIYEGELSKKEFKKKFLTKRQASTLVLGRSRWNRNGMIAFNVKRKLPIRWDDVRIEFDKNNSMYNIQVKGPNGFEKFNAYPVVPEVPIEKNQLTYNRRYLIYQKALLRRAQVFKRNQLKERKKYDANFKKMEEYAWKELQLRMSDEEKLMSKEEWLEYYDGLVANEISAINNSPLSRNRIMRGLTLRGYTVRVPNPISRDNNSSSQQFGFKTVSIDFIDENGLGKLAVTNIFVLDRFKNISQIQGTMGLSPSILSLQQFSSTTIIVELRNGNFGIINSGEIDKHKIEPNKTYPFKTKVVDKNLDTIGDLFKESGIQ